MNDLSELRLCSSLFASKHLSCSRKHLIIFYYSHSIASLLVRVLIIVQMQPSVEAEHRALYHVLDLVNGPRFLLHGNAIQYGWP